MIDGSKISLNTATVRVKWDLHEAIEGCLRHGIAGIAPWRDQVELTTPQFMALLAGSEAFPTTSQPAPGVFEHVFRGLAETHDEMRDETHR